MSILIVAFALIALCYWVEKITGSTTFMGTITMVSMLVVIGGLIVMGFLL